MIVRDEAVGNDELSVTRATTALFLMAFGYALLSVGLFRLMSFTLSSTAFFVLYVAVGFPIGAYFAHRLTEDWSRGLRASIAMLACMFVLLPLLGWLATKGPVLVTSFAVGEFDAFRFWQRLAYQLLVVTPFFSAWGFAEFVGYEVALRSNSRVLRGGFYLIFVWALAAAVGLGFWAIPHLGFLRTLTFSLLAAVLAYHVLRGARFGRRRALVCYGLVAFVGIGIPALEQPFVRLVYSQGPLGVGRVLRTETLPEPWGRTEPAPTAVLSAQWGKYSHVSLVTRTEKNSSLLLGGYDGIVFWTADSAGSAPSSLLESSFFDIVSPHLDIAVLGAGGGRQVGALLAREPRSIVAIDIIPEVFTLLQGANAWANGNVYESPLVKTVAADGRTYLANTEESFDLILLPYTESWGAAVRGLFEPGQRVHSVEAFRVMRQRLKPTGALVIIKGLLADERLFSRYATSLREAGLDAHGWIAGSQFALIATQANARSSGDSPSPLREDFGPAGFRYVDFQESPSQAVAIYDDSPWSMGQLGIMIPPRKLKLMFLGVGLFATLCVALLVGLALRNPEAETGRYHQLTFVLAGMGVGMHAVYLQNGVIFWLLVNLLNPLAAFFVGASLFLIAWGLSSTLLSVWRYLLLVGAVGILALFLIADWDSYLSLGAMGLVAVGTGLLFPLLGLSFKSRLLLLFVSDAVGGLVGGLLGIWVPVLAGLGAYFDSLPWVSLSTVVLATLGLAGRVRQNQEP